MLSFILICLGSIVGQTGGSAVTNGRNNTTMNYDAKSPSLSDDSDRQTRNESRTTGRQTPVNNQPSEADDGVTGANDWCDWCGRGPSTDEELDADETCPSTGDSDEQHRRPAYDQLRFCSRSCLSRYKMDLFCRETQRYLQQLQGSDRLNSGIGTDDGKQQQRILITPELWSQPEPGDDHAVSVDPQSAWNNGDHYGAARRRCSNGDRSGDESEGLSAARPKVRKVSDRFSTSQRPGRNSTSDAAQSTYFRGTASRTPNNKDLTTTSRCIKSESGITDALMGASRPDVANISLPWMLPTSTPVPNSLTSPFPRGFFTNPLWPHTSPDLPPTAVRPPSLAAAGSMPLGLGAAGWPPAGLVPPTAMFVPYPVPIPLPLPLPIPVPIPISKSAADGCQSGQVFGDNETRESNSQLGDKNCSSGKPRSGDRWSTTPKSTSGSSSSSALSSDTWNVLDLSTGGARSRSIDSSAKISWTDAVTPADASSTIDASPYLARRSLILDAPAVDRKCSGEQNLSVGGVRPSSLLAMGKRFNHHRRRTTTIPLVKSK